MFRIYFISDSTLTPSEAPAGAILEAIRAGVEMVQVREKSLAHAAVLDITRKAVAAAGRAGAEVYVNGRFDLALAAGATGVHLPSTGLPVAEVRRIAGGSIRIGRSTHSVAEVKDAEDAGADFVVFGPVFETPSKARYGPPVGLAFLEEAASAVRIPVYAIGGIHPGNVDRIAALPVAGAAVISAIARAGDRAAAVERIRAAARRVRGED